MATEVLADSLGEEWKVSSAEECVRVVFGELKVQNFLQYALVSCSMCTMCIWWSS